MRRANQCGSPRSHFQRYDYTDRSTNSDQVAGRLFCDTGRSCRERSGYGSPAIADRLSRAAARHAAVAGAPRISFWPDSSEQQALTNLRHLLHELRQALPDGRTFLEADNRTVAWKVDAACAVDISDFEHAIASAQEATQRGDHATAKAALERAAQAYHGDFLPGCDGEWVETERERLRQTFGTALERLVGWHEESRDYPAAIRHCTTAATTRSDTRDDQLHLDAAACCCPATAPRPADYRGLCHDVGARTQRRPRQGASSIAGSGVGRVLRSVRVRALTGKGSDDPGVFFAGRDTEWRTLRAAWKEAAVGRAGMVVILGEAGIGKSPSGRGTLHMGGTTGRHGRAHAVVRGRGATRLCTGGAVAAVPIVRKNRRFGRRMARTR